MPRRWLAFAAVFVVAAVAAILGVEIADAAAPPKVVAVIHGINGATGKPNLTFLGTKLNKVKTVHMTGPAGGVSGDLANIVVLGKTGFTGDIPDTIVQRAATSPPEVYDVELVALNLHAFVTIPTPTLSQGVVARGSVLRDTIDSATVADLDDAMTLGGAARAAFVEESEILSGGKLLPAVIPFGTGHDDVVRGDSVFDAFGNLVALNRVGPGASQVAAGDHNHDATYLKLSGGTMTSSIAWNSLATRCVDASASFAGGEAVRGQNAAGTTNSAGVLGQATSTTGSGIGVRGISAGASGVGVVGDSPGTGVIATASGTTGIGIFATIGSNSVNAIPLLIDRPQGGNGDEIVVRQAGTNVFRVSAAGTCFANGNFSFGGADLAERVKVDRAAAEFEPGDVLAIDPTGTRRFKLSDAADSTLVVGVYSTRPGLLGGLSSAMDERWRRDEVPLAIVGIVPTKVCDEGGAIRPGDLLVSASKPGHAKRAPENPRAGTVLGKALGAMAKGTGNIEVFLVSR